MIAYVTSFSKDIYKSTGKHLIKSFLAKEVEGSLFTFTDGDFDIESSDLIVRRNHYDDNIFNSWLDKNKPNIPAKYGGGSSGCSCKGGEHSRGCCHAFWNKRASQWARKTFAMKSVIDDYSPDVIVWIDSDSVFDSKLTAKNLDKIIFDSCAVYHYGPFRKKKYGSAETGLMAFRDSGYFIINKVYNRYLSQEYLKEPRWDDSHLYTLEFEKNDCCTDLITEYRQDTHVVHRGPFKKFITHKKGHHHRSKIR